MTDWEDKKKSRPLSRRSWLAHFWRRTPQPPHAATAVPTRIGPGWEPLPEDVAEWMGMNPYPGPVPEQRSA